jgi:NADPH:quinone reductase-like Zn-dependent oxidoreductase
MKAVQYDGFGPIDVLEVRDVPQPAPGAGEVLVQIRAAGINPGETNIRTGALAEMFPSTFPSGQGSDLAGVITELGDGVTGWQVGDEVLGWVDTRSSHAGLAAVPVENLIAKPASVSWEVAGSLYVAGATAWAAVRAIDPQPGETVVVSGAAGGVGGLAVQLVAERGATVLGIAGPANHEWLKDHGVTPIGYDGGLDEVTSRIQAEAPAGVDAFLDTFGQGYVDVALSLGVAKDRINTVIDFAAAGRHGIQSVGNAAGANVPDLTELVDRLADGRLELPIAAAYPLAEVREAFTELEKRHTRGKIVLIP